MTSHRVLFDMHLAQFRGEDPGDTNSIVVDRWGTLIDLVTAAAETRTLPRPTRVGLSCTLYFLTDVDNCTVTVTGDYDHAGNSSLVFTDVGDWAQFVSFYDGTNYHWRMTGSGGVDETVLAARYSPLLLALDNKGTIVVPLGSITEEDGTALTIFGASSATPGFSQESDKELVLRWHNHANPDGVAFTVPIPLDLDATADITIHWLADMSGATDTPVILHEVYFGKGDTDAAGTDDEVDGGATITEYTATTLAANVQAAPDTLTVVFQPTDGELGTDDMRVYAVWVEYTKKVVAV